jgi:hypothetical protein
MSGSTESDDYEYVHKVPQRSTTTTGPVSFAAFAYKEEDADKKYSSMDNVGQGPRSFHKPPRPPQPTSFRTGGASRIITSDDEDDEEIPTPGKHLPILNKPKTPSLVDLANSPGGSPGWLKSRDSETMSSSQRALNSLKAQLSRKSGNKQVKSTSSHHQKQVSKRKRKNDSDSGSESGSADTEQDEDQLTSGFALAKQARQKYDDHQQKKGRADRAARLQKRGIPSKYILIECFHMFEID